MNRKQLSGIAKRLQRVIPHLLVHERSLFIKPIREVLRGVHLDCSGDPQRFYAWAFFQVLCVPSDGLYFNLGWRLGGGSHAWNASDPADIEKLEIAIAREALPFLDPIITPRDAALAGKRMGKSADGESLRAIAYAFARNGDTAQAVRELDRFIALGEGDSRLGTRAGPRGDRSQAETPVGSSRSARATTTMGGGHNTRARSRAIPLAI